MPTINDSLMDFVLEEIISDILSGKLKEGNFLASKRQLANKYNVSRTVIDRAIDQLVIMGYLERKESNYSLVNDFNRFENLDDLVYFSKFDDQIFSKKQIEDIKNLKAGLDCISVKLIKLPISDDVYNELKELILPIETVCSRCNKVNCIPCAEAIYDFYDMIANLSGNLFVPWLYKVFRKTNIRIISAYISDGKLEDIYKKTSLVLEALHSGKRREAIEIIDKTFEW